MTLSRRSLWEVSALGLAAALCCPAMPAAAQDQPVASSDDDGTEIVVTARRREETLIDVPIALTVFSGEQLESQGAIDVTDIGATTPNVTLEASRATNSTLTAFIRGVGQQDPVAGFEQGVGIYLDDVYLNRPQAAVLDIYDVDRIEVLRGPQGTLYGRNTIGGAVKYVTRRLPDHAELRARANLGNYKQADLIVSGSAPLGTRLVRIGVSGARLSRGGFGDNLTTGEENYNKDIWAGRFSLEVNNDGDFFGRLTADYTHDLSTARGGGRLIRSYFTNAPVLANPYDTRGSLNSPRQEVEAYGGSLFLEGKPTDWLTFRSITAWRKDNSSTPIDFDALPTVDLDVPGFYYNRQTSQEIQMLVAKGPVNAIFGGYYLDASARTAFDVRLFSTVNGLTAFTDAVIDTKTSAVFGDVTVDLGPQFSISAGGRYTWDQRDARILRQNYLGGGSPLFGGAGVAFGAPGTDFRGRRNFNKFTPRVSVSFKPSPEHHIFASYSQGFKGGGFDPRGVGANAPDTNGNGTRDSDEVAAFLGFRPESVKSYEIGYKGSLFDKRLDVAATVFHANYADVQIPGSSACTVSGLPSFCGVVTNAGRARFRGVELEMNARLGRDVMAQGDSLRLAGTLGYIDARFLEYFTFIAGRGTVDVTNFRKIQNTPKVTASGTLTYTAPVGSGLLNFNSTLSYRSKTYQFEVPTPVFGFDQPGYALWDASLVYTARDGGWSIGLHGKNLTDKRYVTSGYNFLSVDPVTGVPARDGAGNFVPALGKEGTLTAFYGNPRQVFVTFGVKFR